jgi:oxidase EvaA
LKTAGTLAELQNFKFETLIHSNFSLQKINLSSQTDWSVKDGAISHKSGGFFHVAGCRSSSGEEHLVLYQPQGAYNGLLTYKSEDETHLLLQARVEPGNTGVVQYGPTVQSTPANYLRLHKGKPTAYLDYFMGYRSDCQPISQSTQLDLGRRYFQKTKTLSFIECDEMIPTEENYIWVPLKVIKQAVVLDNFLNTDLRSMLSLVAIKDHLQPPPTFSAPAINPLQSDRFNSSRASLAPLEKLINWRLSDRGVESVSSEGNEVYMYKVSCTNRETSVWTQPLFHIDKIGAVIMMLRIVKEELQVLLSIDNEFGISGGFIINPSFVLDDESLAENLKDSEIIAQLLQSEEGGRFMENQFRYMLMEANKDYIPNQNQTWVSITELCRIFQCSNMASIHLRSIASMLLSI